MSIVQFAVGGIHLIETRLFRILDIDDRDPVLTVSDICISSRDINIARVFKRHESPIDYARRLRRCYINYLQTFVIDNETISKLDRDRFRMIECETVDDLWI